MPDQDPLPRRQRHYEAEHDMCGTPTEDCLFAEPWLPTDIQQQAWEGIPEIRRQSETADDRLFAILHATVIEWRIDTLMAPLFHRYDEIRSLPIGNKLRLLKAMTLIPDHVLEATQLCMKIRNVFAHHVEVSTFEHERVREHQGQLQGFLQRPHLLPKNEAKRTARRAEIRAASVRELYADVNGHCTMGLLLYRHNVRLLGETLRSDRFYWDLFDEADRRWRAEYEAQVDRRAMLPTLDEHGNVIYDPRAAQKDGADG